VWANVNVVESLPEPFGLRLCEIEVYERYNLRGNQRYDIESKFDRGMGMTPPLDTENKSTVKIAGLTPNKTYE
ncbi:unnamed protein product, partial [Polarella glacialis]